MFSRSMMRGGRFEPFALELCALVYLESRAHRCASHDRFSSGRGAPTYCFAETARSIAELTTFVPTMGANASPMFGNPLISCDTSTGCRAC